MKALIDAQLFREISRDRERVTQRRMRNADAQALVIRNSSPDDAGRIERLAILDSAPRPNGPMLVAERGGMLIAAVPLGGGRSIADPFERSADVVGLLELRRAQLRPA